MKKVIAIALLCALLLTSLAAFSSCGGMKRYSHTDVTVFDTQTVILGYDKSEEEFQKKAELIMERLTFYHELYDIYYNYEGKNNLKTVNDNAGKSPVEVDGAIIDLLEYCIDMYELTDGKTNVAMGSVLKIWHRYRTEGIADPERAAIPKMEELQAAAEHCSIDDLVIDREKKTVYLKDCEMSLDVGAVAKGYATQMVAEYIEEQGFSGFALSVGGNVKCIGERADGKKWEIGVQNPDLSAESAYFTKVYLTDQSLVTSGVYQRFYTVNGKEYHHIIDPDTLMPKREFASVSVITDHSGLADALSTALFNMTYEEGFSLVSEIEDAGAVWVYADGSIKSTEAFDRLKSDK